MYSFDTYLKKHREVGSVIGVNNAFVTVEGMPTIAVRELVAFENKAIGMTYNLNPDAVQVMHLDGEVPPLGCRATLTKEQLEVEISESMLGSIVDGLGRFRGGKRKESDDKNTTLKADTTPLPIHRRKPVTEPFETGVGIVDLLVPLARGQRELVIGDRKTGKTEFVRQAMWAHILNGGVAVYAGIGMRAADLRALSNYFESKGALERLVRVASLATDPTAACYLTPYTAMAIAEAFRDKGMHVLIVFDDMTMHAKYCREMALLSRQTPGRNAYPGDIFYSHSRLMERAGVFDTGSITALPIANTVLGDLSGYIQTNLMSMTDGHLYFDRDLYNQGKRPPVNVFLSVSRVGRQTQTPLLRSLSQELLRFLSHHERLLKLEHFGGELTGDVKMVISLGEQLHTFFEQTDETIVPIAVNAICIASIWGEMWRGYTKEQMRERVKALVKRYYSDPQLKAQLTGMMTSFTSFSQITDAVKKMPDLILGATQ